MFRQRVVLTALAATVTLLVGILIGWVTPRLATLVPGLGGYNRSAVIQQIRTLSDLVTVQYVLEKVVILEVPPEGVLAQMFAGENRILMVAHGVVKAGLDLGQLAPGDLVISSKTIRVKLPPAHITDAYLDEKQTCVIERTTGRFRAFDKDLEKAARENALDDIRRAARLNGILKDADSRARLQLSNLFHQLGFEQIEFER